MKFVKSMALLGLGVGATVAYQKYSKPAFKEFEKLMNKTVKKVNNELDEMM